jgi:hypothetical protein
MEERLQQLVTQVQLLTKEAERSQAATALLENARFADMQRTMDLQAQVITMAAAAAATKPQLARVTFVDTKGIGKPATFSSELKQFPTWSFKLGNFLEGILKGMKDGLEWAADQDSLILDLTPLETILEPGVDVKDAGRQTYAVLAQLCDGEALDLIQNVIGSDGWEAYRVLSRRFDPQGAGRRRNIMSQLLQPGSFDPQALNSAIARWEEKVRIYERRSGSKLPDDIKSSILTEMTKGPLREHLILNAAKLKSYEGVREEIQCYLENRQNAEPMSMDVDAFTKGKGTKGGKGSGKGTDVCKNCGKTGHWARDCRGPGGGADKSKGEQSKGKGGKGSGKGTFDGNCKHCGKYGHKADACWSNPANKTTAGKGKGKSKGKGKGKTMYALEWTPPEASEEKTLEGLDLCAVFLDLCAVYREQWNDKEWNSDWWKWNHWTNEETTEDAEYEEIEATVDSGSAVCAFPSNLCVEIPLKACEASRNGVHFKTASGERVPHQGMRTIECITEGNLIRKLTGAVTGVKKVLLAVSRLTETGHYVHFTSTGGYIENKTDGSRIPMHLKNGVYIIKLWVRVSGTAWAYHNELASLSGGTRPARRP